MPRETHPLDLILEATVTGRQGACRGGSRWYIQPESPSPTGIEMLDAFIIHRIRQEQESKRPARQPMRIEVPQEPPAGYRGQPDPRVDAPEEPSGDRGVAIIDFTI